LQILTAARRGATLWTSMTDRAPARSVTLKPKGRVQ